MSKKVDCSNCLNCSVGPIIAFTRWLGLPYINISCKHKNNISKTYIKISKFCLFTSILVLSILIVSAVYNYFHIKHVISLKAGQLFDIVVLFPGFTGACTAVVANIGAILQVQDILKVIYKCEKLMHIWYKQMKDTLLNVEDVRSLRTRNYLHLLIIFITISVAIILLFVINSDVDMPIIMKISVVLVIYVEMLSCSIVMIIAHLNRILQWRIFLYLKADLDFLLIKDRSNLHRPRHGKLNTRRSLSIYCQFHTYNLNFLRDVSTYLSPSGGVYILNFVLIFISIFFLVLDCIINGNLFKLLTPQLLFFELHLLVTGITFWYLVYLCECFAKWGQKDSLAYLYQYPRNKLNEEEAWQVEILTKTISIQKPVIVFSDVISMQKGLYAVVTGVVVTYVLNLIQLQHEWNKKKE